MKVINGGKGSGRAWRREGARARLDREVRSGSGLDRDEMGILMTW
jgi:hypothetical protein